MAQHGAHTRGWVNAALPSASGSSLNHRAVEEQIAS